MTSYDRYFQDFLLVEKAPWHDFIVKILYGIGQTFLMNITVDVEVTFRFKQSVQYDDN